MVSAMVQHPASHFFTALQSAVYSNAKCNCRFPDKLLARRVRRSAYLQPSKNFLSNTFVPCANLLRRSSRRCRLVSELRILRMEKGRNRIEHRTLRCVHLFFFQGAHHRLSWTLYVPAASSGAWNASRTAAPDSTGAASKPQPFSVAGVSSQIWRRFF